MPTQALAPEQPSVSQHPAYGVVRYTFVPSNMSLFTSNSSLATGTAQMRQAGEIALGAEPCDTAIAWADLDRHGNQNGPYALPGSSTNTLAECWEPARLKFSVQALNFQHFDIARGSEILLSASGPKEMAAQTSSVRAFEDAAKIMLLWHILASAATVSRLPTHQLIGRITTGFGSMHWQTGYHIPGEQPTDQLDCATEQAQTSRSSPVQVVAGRLHSRPIKPEATVSQELFQALDSLRPDQLKRRIVKSGPMVMKRGQLESRRDS